MKYNKYELVMKKVKVHDVKKEYDVSCSHDVFEFANKLELVYQFRAKNHF